MRWTLILVLLAGAGLLAGCGAASESSAGSDPAALAVPWVDPDGDAPYIGSLSVNPGDGSMFMATNTGLFEIPEAGGKPAKVTGTAEDPQRRGRGVRGARRGVHRARRADRLRAPERRLRAADRARPDPVE